MEHQKRRAIVLSLMSVAAMAATAVAQQSETQRWRLSGYIQAQYQRGERDAQLKVGGANADTTEAFSRIGVRRGFVKLTYSEKLVTGVFQLNITEKGIGLKDAWLSVHDPWRGIVSLKAGVFDRPFGYEISYSSAVREAPERSLLFLTLFPEERDLGASLSLQAPETSGWHFLKLETGLFAGNGIKQETDNRRDFIGHLSADKQWGDFQVGGGLSYYYGKVFQGSEKVYRMNGASFVENDNPDNKGRFAVRQYTGCDLRLSLHWALGDTKLLGEYLWGEQPGNRLSSKSPNAGVLPSTDTYIRPFSGGYAMIVQDAGRWPLAFAVKYDWYDPNTQVVGNDIGTGGTGKADIKIQTLGFGLLWKASSSIRLQAWYDMPRNETSTRITAFADDRPDDVFTLRLQYKF